jgi:serine/threonine-protein kinase
VATRGKREDRMQTARELGEGVQRYLDGDRDLARRRDLARHHARRAQEAFALIGDAARAKAMREAGRALVLDQNNVDAQGVLAHLLLDAPDQIPEVARDDANRQRSLTRQTVLRKLWPGYLALFVLMASLYYFPLIHPVPVVIGHAFTLALAIVVWAASRRPLPVRSHLVFAIVWLNAAALACGAIVFGPLMIVPVYLIGTIAGTLSQPLGYRWPAIVFPPVLAFVVPLGLELVGIMPSSFHIDHGLVLTSWVLDLTSSLAAAIMIVAVLSQTVIAVVIMTMARTAQDQAQDRLHAQTWHLEQLLPRRSTSQKTPDNIMSSGYR